MKKKCPTRLKNRVLNITNNLYDDCVRTVFGLASNAPVDDTKMLLDMVRDMANYRSFPDLIHDKEIDYFLTVREQVSDMYLQNMCKLPTKALNDIIKAHELEGGIKRAQKTIEMILNELARRGLMDDSSETNSVEKKGGTGGRRKKSKTRSKKTNVKRRKTT